MAIIVNYTKSFYQSKISELEGFHKQLSTHVDSMRSLKEKMFQFWNDDEAREVSKLLNDQIHKCQTAMDRTEDIITIYKSTVDKFGGLAAANAALLEEADSLLSSVGSAASSLKL